MRLLVTTAALALGLLAAEAPASPVCCDLWIFEPAGGRSESYAVQMRGSGRTVIAELSDAQAPRFVADPAARALLRRWIAASHKRDASSILIDARSSDFHIGPRSARDEASDPEARDGDTLIYIRHASAEKTRAFVDDIDELPADLRLRMKAVLTDR